MDIDDWEFLSDDGFLDFNEDGENQILLVKRKSESKGVLFDMDYFCTSPNSRKITEPPPKNPPRVPNQLVPVPIRFEPRIGKTPDDEFVKEIIENHPMETTEKIKGASSSVVEADQDTVSQVFFKIKENEFVDMKMDSPKSSSKGLLPPIDAGTLKFENKGEVMEVISSPRMKTVEKEMVSMECENDEDSNWEENNTNGFNIWKWSLTGVGAICSFGVAAATICILFFGSQQSHKVQQNQKIQFQIYTDDDKGINQVVNEAISAVRGVPLSREHITIGGYYDGL